MAEEEDGAQVDRYRELLGKLERGEVRELVFAVPDGTGWALPLYELALLTAAWLFERRVVAARLTLVTPERAPLAAFGGRASDTVAELLDRHGVALRCAVSPRAVREGALVLGEGLTVPAERVVALARLEGPALPGLPGDPDGFVPVDGHGRVPGVEDVYAAGDVTTWPMKQGGLAAQQADAVAESLAAWAGTPVRPTAFRPVLRGVLLTGERPAFLRADSRPHRTRSIARLTPLWWPPAKVAAAISPPISPRGASPCRRPESQREGAAAADPWSLMWRRRVMSWPLGRDRRCRSRSRRGRGHGGRSVRAWRWVRGGRADRA